MIARPSDLSRAITNAQWDVVLKILQDCPELAKKKSNRPGLFDGKNNATVYPLHEVLLIARTGKDDCSGSGRRKTATRLDCIKSLIKAYPSALAKKESSYHRLPLHCACRNNLDVATITYLIVHHKAACFHEDTLGRLPVHYALTNGANPEVIGVFLQADPASVRGCDYVGWTPVHVALNVGTLPVPCVQDMLKAFPESVLLRTVKGHSVEDVISQFCPNREQYLQLIEETKNGVQSTVQLPSLRENSTAASQLIMA